MRIFINYAEQDQEFVTELGRVLQEVGYQPWIDTPQAGTAMVWENDITKAVLKQSIVILNVVSQAALDAQYCRDNLNQAILLSVPVVHLLRENVKIPKSQEAPSVDVQEGLTTIALPRLIALVNDVNKRHQHIEKSSAEPVAVNDLPAGSDELGFNDYALAFAEMVANPNVQPPLTVGIYGPGGTGKTFLMHKIQEEIERIKATYLRERRQWKETPPAQTLTVNFDAWAYNASDILWAGMIQQIFKKIEDQFGTLGRIRLTLTRNVQREGRQLARQMIYLVMFILAIIVPLYLILRELNFDQLAELVPFLSLPVLVRVGNDLAQLLATPQSRQVAGFFATSRQYQQQRRLLSSVLQERDRSILARVYDDMDKMLGALPPGTRLVIFIDDLDRCNPERVVDVLEAMNVLLAFKQFIVFLAIDPRIVASVVEASYGDTLRRAGISGYEYLDKIVQLPLTIPKPRQRDVLKYLNTLIEAPVGESNSAAFLPASAPKAIDSEAAKMEGQGLSMTDLELAQANDALEEEGEIEIVTFTLQERSAFRAFSPFMDSTPRSIKRLVNIYRLVRALAKLQRSTVVEEAPAKMILWLLLCQQWPYATANLLDALRRSPDSAINLEELYRQVALGLDKDATGRHKMLDYDNYVLDEIIAQYGKHITGKDIFTMQSLTLNFHPALATEIRAFLE